MQTRKFKPVSEMNVGITLEISRLRVNPGQGLARSREGREGGVVYINTITQDYLKIARMGAMMIWPV